MKKREYIIRINATPGSSHPPLFWTGGGWVTSRPDAMRYPDAGTVEGLLTRLNKDWLLRPTMPAYDTKAGAKLEREVW